MKQIYYRNTPKKKLFIEISFLYYYYFIGIYFLNAERQRRYERKTMEVRDSSTLPWKDQRSVSPFTVTLDSLENLSNDAPAPVGVVNKSTSNIALHTNLKKEKVNMILNARYLKAEIGNISCVIPFTSCSIIIGNISLISHLPNDV